MFPWAAGGIILVPELGAFPEPAKALKSFFTIMQIVMVGLPQGVKLAPK